MGCLGDLVQRMSVTTERGVGRRTTVECAPDGQNNYDYNWD